MGDKQNEKSSNNKEEFMRTMLRKLLRALRLKVKSHSLKNVLNH